MIELSAESLRISPMTPRHVTPKSDDRETQHKAARIGTLAKQIISNLDLPFHEVNNKKRGEKIQKSTMKWIERFDIIPNERLRQKVSAASFGVFMSNVHPDTSLNRTKIIADFATWLFLYDDRIEECNDLDEIKKRHKRTLEIVIGAEVRDEDDALMKGLHDIMKRIEKENPEEEWKARFIKDIALYCRYTHRWEAKNRLEKRVPTLEEYNKKRPYTSGTLIMFDLIEFAEKITLTEEEFKSRPIKMLRKDGTNMVIDENDGCSAEGECLRGDFHNTILILMKEGYTVEAAMKKWHSSFLKNIEHYKKYYYVDYESENVKKYNEGIMKWLSGHHFWAKQSPRYHAYFEKE